MTNFVHEQRSLIFLDQRHTSDCLVTEAHSEFACLHVGGDVGVGYLLICRVSLQVSCWLNQNFSKGSKTCIVLEDMY